MAPFFTIWTGQQLSLVGSRAAQFALVWWLTLETGSATVLATASLVALAPQILLGPFVGALIDRWNRRVVMIAADSFIALVGLWLAYLFWSGTMEIWHVYAVMLARSLGGTFHWPAMAASTTLMVPEKHYTRISGLNQTIHGLLSLLGPPLGALLLSIMPLHGVMLFDVGTAAFAVLPLLFVAVPQPKQEHVATIKTHSFLSNARDALRFVLHWPGMMVLLAGASILKIVLMPALSLLSLLVKNHFGGEAAEYGFMEVMEAMIKDGLQNSLSDAGVGVLCARTAVLGAYFNMKINAKDIKDRVFAEDILSKAEKIYQQTLRIEEETIAFIDSKM